MTRPRRPSRSLLVPPHPLDDYERGFLRGCAGGVLLALTLLSLAAGVAGLCALAGW